jgi:hypothetical protein
MKTLKELCKSKILARYSIFKESLNVLPDDLNEEIKNGEFNLNYQIIEGKIYSRINQPFAAYNDWLTYKF